MVLAAKGRNVPIPKTLNHSTGKISSRQTGFNDKTWGRSTRLYLKSIQKFPDDKFQTVMNRAMEFSKVCSAEDSDTILDGINDDDDDDDDERAQLVDVDSDDEFPKSDDESVKSDSGDESDDCKSIYTPLCLVF